MRSHSLYPPGAAPEAETATTTSVCQLRQTAYTVMSGSRSPVDDNFVTAYAQTTVANSMTHPGSKWFAADAFSPMSATFSSSISASMLPATSTSPSATTTRVPPPLERSTGLAMDTSVVVGMAGKFVGWFGRDGEWVSGGEEGGGEGGQIDIECWQWCCGEVSTFEVFETSAAGYPVSPAWIGMAMQLVRHTYPDDSRVQHQQQSVYSMNGAATAVTTFPPLS